MNTTTETAEELRTRMTVMERSAARRWLREHNLGVTDWERLDLDKERVAKALETLRELLPEALVEEMR